MTTHATMPAPDAVEASTKLACFDCGYDLRGQPPEGRCPECGLEVTGTLSRLRELQKRSNPRPLRRAAWFILAAGGMSGSMIAIFLVVLMLPFTFLGELEWFLIGAFVTTTLGAALFSGLAAGTLAGSSQPGLVRRMLGLLAWAVPALVTGTWVLAWLASVDHGFFTAVESAIQAVGIACWFAAALFPPISLIEMRRRVRLWPHWQWLSNTMYAVLWPLWAGFLCISGLVLLDLVATHLLDGFAYGYRMGQIMTTIGSAGSLTLLLAIPAYLLCLILMLIGLRRLPQSVPGVDQPTPSGSTSCTSS